VTTEKTEGQQMSDKEIGRELRKAWDGSWFGDVEAARLGSKARELLCPQIAVADYAHMSPAAPDIDGQAGQMAGVWSSSASTQNPHPGEANQWREVVRWVHAKLLPAAKLEGRREALAELLEFAKGKRAARWTSVDQVLAWAPVEDWACQQLSACGPGAKAEAKPDEQLIAPAMQAVERKAADEVRRHTEAISEQPSPALAVEPLSEAEIDKVLADWRISDSYGRPQPRKLVEMVIKRQREKVKPAKLPTVEELAKVIEPLCSEVYGVIYPAPGRVGEWAKVDAVRYSSAVLAHLGAHPTASEDVSHTSWHGTAKRLQAEVERLKTKLGSAEHVAKEANKLAVDYQVEIRDLKQQVERLTRERDEWKQWADKKLDEQAGRIHDLELTVEMKMDESDEQRERIEQLTVQLAGCSVVANGGDSKEPAKQGDYGWSVAYQDVLDLRRKSDEQAAEIARLKAERDSSDSALAVALGTCGSKQAEGTAARELAELRRLAWDHLPLPHSKSCLTCNTMRAILHLDQPADPHAGHDDGRVAIGEQVEVEPDDDAPWVLAKVEAFNTVGKHRFFFVRTEGIPDRLGPYFCDHVNRNWRRSVKSNQHAGHEQDERGNCYTCLDAKNAGKDGAK